MAKIIIELANGRIQRILASAQTDYIIINQTPDQRQHGHEIHDVESVDLVNKKLWKLYQDEEGIEEKQVYEHLKDWDF